MLDSPVNLLHTDLGHGLRDNAPEVPLVGNRLLQSQVPQISVQELKQLLSDQKKSLVLVDVRNPNEYELAQLPGWVLIPLPQVQSGAGITKIKQLIEDKRRANPEETPHLIVMCKIGVRSAKTLVLLKEVGISGINVTGGIDAWSREVDPSIPQYSLKDMAQPQLIFTKSHSKIPRLLLNCGLVMAAGVVTSVLAVRQNPDLLRPFLQVGIPLEYASDLPVLADAIQAAKLPQMDVKTLKQLSKSEDFLLVDVRDQKEYRASHFPGAVLVPLTDIETGKGITKIRSMQQGRLVIVYSTSGKRSARALIQLQNAKVNATQLKGGIKAWNQEGRQR